MNTRRIVVLLLAAGAAGIVALMVRGFLGGGSKQAEASVSTPVAISQVLVASQRIEPGQPVNGGQVRWQQWPAKSVDPSFIIKNPGMTAAAAVKGTVARAPMVEGEPVTYAKIVKSKAAGYMAATLAPGMRAVAINVSMASVAGGFVLPNDRVDVMMTQITGDNPKRGMTRTVLSNVRVLAINQVFDSKTQKPLADVKTITLELTPNQSREIAQAQAMGSLSLALRSLGDTRTAARTSGSIDGTGMVAVIRYGMERRGGGGQ